MRRIDEQYLKTPYYGSRRMAAWLRREGYGVGRERVRRLMRLMGLEAIYKKPNTSRMPKLLHRRRIRLGLNRIRSSVTG